MCKDWCLDKTKHNIIIFHAIYDPRFSRSVNWAVFGVSWWRHQMETFSAILALCAGNSSVSGEFPSHRTVTWSFVVFFDLSRNERLSKQSIRWWFETPSGSLWRHYNVFFGTHWLPEYANRITVLDIVMSYQGNYNTRHAECDITMLWCTAHNTTD